MTELQPAASLAVAGAGVEAVESNAEDGEQLPPPPETADQPSSKARTVLILTTIAGISFLNTFGSGLLTVAIPRIATDLQLAEGLLLWPASVYVLALGCTLLVVGAIADIVGNRPVFLTGCALLAVFTLGCGLVWTGIQLIMFRAFQGVSMSFCLPTAVGIITSSFPEGKTRNIAFASLGGGQPPGFAFGLVLGGVFVDSVGWRYGYYLACIFNAMILLAAFFTLPETRSLPNKRHRLAQDIDWIGAITASTSLGMPSYVFA